MSATEETLALDRTARPIALSGLTRRLTGRLAEVLAAGGLVGILAAGLTIAVEAAGSRSTFFVPAGRAGFPDWLRGPLAELGSGLSSEAFSVLFLVMCACYLALLATARAVRLRWIVATVAALHLVYLLAPPLLSGDVIGYIGYARLGAVHGLTPYTHAAFDAYWDPVYPYLRWPFMPSPYGPLFTVLSYPLASVGVPAALWALKAALAAASLACVGLVWACARRLGRDPAAPAVLVGLNPLLLVHGVGGAHNDLLMVVFVVGAIYLVLGSREVVGGAALAAAVATKVPAAAVAPFAIVGARRPGRVLTGVVIAGAALGAGAFAAFGPELLGFLSALGQQDELVSKYSGLNQLRGLLGLPEVTPALRLASAAVLAAIVVGLLVRTRRGADWITMAAWATFALLVTTHWLLAWYVVWLLPLTALSQSRRLWGATLALSGWIVLTRVPILLG